MKYCSTRRSLHGSETVNCFLFFRATCVHGFLFLFFDQAFVMFFPRVSFRRTDKFLPRSPNWFTNAAVEFQIFLFGEKSLHVGQSLFRVARNAREKLKMKVYVLEIFLAWNWNEAEMNMRALHNRSIRRTYHGGIIDWSKDIFIF